MRYECVRRYESNQYVFTADYLMKEEKECTLQNCSM